MAKRTKLKVFRTPIGFHDAYVAATSQKAALEAWGSDSNLFAQGIAEQVTDADLVKEPLARPGEVIRKLRGSFEEQGRAAGKARLGKSDSAAARRRAKELKRANARKAKEALAAEEAKYRAELTDLEKEEDRLANRRRELERTHEAEQGRLRRAIEELSR